MTSLYDAELGADAVIRRSEPDLLRRVRHGDASLVVDTRDEVALNLNLSEAHGVERRMAGRVTRDVPRIGAVTIMPPDCPTRFTITGTCRVLQVRLSWQAMAEALAEDHGVDRAGIELRPSLHADDPVLARLIYAMAVAEDEAAEFAVRRVAVHLLAKYTVRPPIVSPARCRGGLPPVRLRRVLELIEGDLSGSLTLARLANTSGMSPFHFAREFTRMTGLAPHRYVVRRRVDRAILLLARPAMTVAETARRTGFAHASHLARHLYRQTGVTPETFRAQILP